MDQYENDYKSQGEEQIARLLDKNNIEYQYEYPLAIVDHGKTRIWYPDFRLPEHGIIIEYFGMNGDPNYDKQTRHKIQTYKKEGIEGLFLTSDSFRGDWPEKIMGRIRNINENRLKKFNYRH